jgi:serine/threonine protein kinase
LHQTPTLAFLLEDWIDGPSLVEILDRAPLEAPEVLIYARSLCSALETLHKHNYLHLRIAPELIRVDRQGEIFLGGVCTARQGGTIVEYGKWGNYPHLYSSP